MSDLNADTVATMKARLLEEKTQLESDLSSVGEIDPHTKGDWVPKVPDLDGSRSDPNDVADKIEEMGERVGIEVQLEKRFDQIKLALKAIEDVITKQLGPKVKKEIKRAYEKEMAKKGGARL